MALDNETRGIIDRLLSTNKVVLFMKGTPQQPQCGFSAKTVSALDMLIPDFMSVNVLDYPPIREGIKEYANWPTIPQLYIDGELIGGSDIVTDMLQSGELADALGVEDQPWRRQGQRRGSSGRRDTAAHGPLERGACGRIENDHGRRPDRNAVLF
jgi:Grx4 family monothiol glutaredoxin